MSRIQGGNETLFDSPVKHDHRIRIEIKEAIRYRSISNDWIHASKGIVEFEMSETQFARFITSSGMGDGTPITLRWKESVGYIESAPFEHKGKEFEDEIEAISKKAAEGIDKLEKRISEMMLKDKLTKQEKIELQSLIYEVTRKVRDSLPWVTTMFHEKMHKTVEDAKGEIESFLKQQAQALGMQALAERVKVENLSLPSGLDAPDESTEP